MTLQIFLHFKGGGRFFSQFLTFAAKVFNLLSLLTSKGLKESTDFKDSTQKACYPFVTAHELFDAECIIFDTVSESFCVTMVTPPPFFLCVQQLQRWTTQLYFSRVCFTVPVFLLYSLKFIDLFGLAFIHCFVLEVSFNFIKTQYVTQHLCEHWQPNTAHWWHHSSQRKNFLFQLRSNFSGSERVFLFFIFLCPCII